MPTSAPNMEVKEGGGMDGWGDPGTWKKKIREERGREGGRKKRRACPPSFLRRSQSQHAGIGIEAVFSKNPALCQPACLEGQNSKIQG